MLQKREMFCIKSHLNTPPILTITPTPFFFVTPTPTQKSGGFFSFGSPPNKPNADSQSPNPLIGITAAAVTGAYIASQRKKKVQFGSAPKEAKQAILSPNVFQGAQAAALMSAFTAKMEENRQRRIAEKARKAAEMERLNILNYQAVQRKIQEIARAREEARRKRQEAKRKKAARHPLQDLWDRNGAAIYAANQGFKATYGKNMSASDRRKAIKDATVGGVFRADAYADNLVKAATPPPPPPKNNPYAGAADRIRAAANEIEDEKKIGYVDSERDEVRKLIALNEQKNTPVNSATASYMAMAAAAEAGKFSKEDYDKARKQAENNALNRGLRAYYDGRKDGESALSQLINRFRYKSPNELNETAYARMKEVLDSTEDSPVTNFAEGSIPVGDTGFAREYQDGTIWPALPDFENQPGQRGSDNQVGHFLTAVNLSIQVHEKPWHLRWAFKNIYLSAIIGHELLGDDFGGDINKVVPVVALAQTLFGGPGPSGWYARRLFLSGDDDKLRQLFEAGGKPGLGNSLEDLRLSYQGWVAGEKLVDGEFDTTKDFAEWLEKNLR